MLILYMTVCMSSRFSVKSQCPFESVLPEKQAVGLRMDRGIRVGVADWRALAFTLRIQALDI